KRAVRLSSVLASNSPACSGPSAGPTPSSPCVAVISIIGSRTTGRRAARRLDLHFYVAHPRRCSRRMILLYPLGRHMRAVLVQYQLGQAALRIALEGNLGIDDLKEIIPIALRKYLGFLLASCLCK